MSLLWFTIGAISSIFVIAIISFIDNSLTKLKTENIFLENRLETKIKLLEKELYTNEKRVCDLECKIATIPKKK